MKQRESIVLRECLACLSHHGFDVVPPRSHFLFPWREGTKGVVWRNSVGAGWHLDRRTNRIGPRPVYYGLPGSPDLMGFTGSGAKIIGVECKTANGRLRENQKTFRAWIKAAGGVYVVARSYDECHAGLKDHGL